MNDLLPEVSGLNDLIMRFGQQHCLSEDLRGKSGPDAGRLHADVRVSAIGCQMDRLTDPVVRSATACRIGAVAGSHV